MNIAQALKEKNRKTKRLAELATEIKLHNVVSTLNPATPKDVVSIHAAYCSLITQLSDLKGRIANATAPIQTKLQLMALKKNHLAMIRELNVNATPEPVYDQNSKQYINIPRHICIKPEEKDRLIEQLTSEINQLQDELDEYNARTFI